MKLNGSVTDIVMLHDNAIRVHVKDADGEIASFAIPMQQSGDYHVGQKVEITIKVLGPVAMATVHYNEEGT